jgi:hypothetical protein
MLVRDKAQRDAVHVPRTLRHVVFCLSTGFDRKRPIEAEHQATLARNKYCQKITSSAGTITIYTAERTSLNNQKVTTQFYSHPKPVSETS